MAASLDWLTGGRILLNVVTGGHLHELAKDGDFLRDERRRMAEPSITTAGTAAPRSSSTS